MKAIFRMDRWSPWNRRDVKWDYETPPPAGGTAGFMLNTQIETPAPDSDAYGVKAFASLVAKGA